VFRFAAFVDESERELSRHSERLCASGPGWRTVYSASGIRVLCRGTRPGSSEVYRLHGGTGVIVGKLFVTARVLGQPHRHAPLTFEESETSSITASAGRRLISHYWGRYVAVLRDHATKRTWTIRSPGGALPCLRLRLGTTYAYVSCIEDGLLLFDRPPTINWDYIAAWLAVRVNGRETALQEVSQLLSGECETVHDHSATREIYWNPLRTPKARRIRSLSAAVHALREAVRAAVHAWVSCYDDDWNILLSLSGGLDSSIIAACLRDAPSQPRVTCYHHYIEGPDSDEREFAQAVADSLGLPLVTLRRDPATNLRSMLRVRKRATLWNLIHQAELGDKEAEIAVACGATANFTGEGGDQTLFQARATFAAAQCLRLHGPSTHWLTVLLDAARIDGESLWYVLARCLIDLVPGCAWSPRRDVGRHRTLLTPEALDGVRRKRLTNHPWFAGAWCAGSGARWHAAMMSTERPFYDLLLPPDATVPDPVAALMDQPVVEVARAIIEELHIHAGWDRAVARLAFAHDLPESVIARRAKGGFEEHARDMLFANASFASELLGNGQLVRRGIVDGKKIGQVLSPAPTIVGTENLEIYDYLSTEATLLALGEAQ